MSDRAPRFEPTRVGDPPRPKEPKARCHVEGCERVVYKSVVCRAHWNALPIELRIQRAFDAAIGQQMGKVETDLAILELANDPLPMT